MRLVYPALLMLVLACQTPTATTNPTTVDATPVAALAADPPVGAGLMSVWGEVPKQCT
jgi:hypothetical protein